MKKYKKAISQSWLYDKHTESNCNCGNPSGKTELLKSDGAADIEVCMDCFGALGCVY